MLRKGEIMQYKVLGNSSINASVVGLGTWVTGGGLCWDGVDDGESIRAIQTALDLGVNLIDTAPAYGWGHSETVVGKAIQGRRDDVVLATKCGIWWQDDRGTQFANFDGKDTNICLRPETIEIEVENSLQRLGVDYIDLLQVHWPAPEPIDTPIPDTMNALLKLKEAGKIRAIGLCNVSIAQLDEYRSIGDIASDQFRYSMLYPEPEGDVLPYCAENNLATLTYMYLEQGILTGKVGMDREFKEDEFRSDEAWNPWYKLENRPKVLDMLTSWLDLLEKYDCSLAQLVIAWTAAQHGVTHVLCGTRNTVQAEQNAKAGTIVLDVNDIARIRKDAEALGTPQ